MPSLTPIERKSEVTSAAFWEGATNGVLTMIPMGAVLMYARTKPNWWKLTNWQSRTAIFIMPPLFVFGLTAEFALQHKMKHIAAETEHALATVRWADRQVYDSNNYGNNNNNNNNAAVGVTDPISVDAMRLKQERQQLELTKLYAYSVEKQQKENNETIVPELLWYHYAANYAADNPLKVVTAIAVPCVGMIFYGRDQQAHLVFSMKLMQTRVIGQFATISLLLSVMVFRQYMNQHGRFVTQQHVDERIQRMHQTREQLQARLQADRERQQMIRQELERARQQDRDKKTSKKKKATKTPASENNESAPTTEHSHEAGGTTIGLEVDSRE